MHKSSLYDLLQQDFLPLDTVKWDIPITFYTNQEFQTKTLGRFEKKGTLLPYKKITVPKINMQMGALMGDPQEFDDWQKDNNLPTPSRVLIGVSGVGKTSRIFHVARQGFVLYNTAADGIEDQDACYQQFFIDVNKTSNQLEAEVYFTLWIASKLVALYHLLSRHPDLTPEQFLIMQLNGRSKTFAIVYMQVKEYYREFELPNNLELFAFLTGQIKRLIKQEYKLIGIAFDEASLMDDCCRNM
jgi:hypothetical protein